MRDYLQSTDLTKGKVESGVHYVKRNFLAGREPEFITRSNEKLLEWVEGIAGTRIPWDNQGRALGTVP